MSRRSRAQEETFTLFPFLAVLLCVMGTLALIFALVSQKTSDAPLEEDALAEVSEEPTFDLSVAASNCAIPGKTIDVEEANALIEKKASAEDDAYAEALVKTNAATLDEILNEMESLDWFLEELQGVREKTTAALDEERKRLANAEAALERLRADSDVARKKYDALMAEKDENNDEDASALQENINALDVEIERLRQEAEQLRRQNAEAGAKRSYAILPYQGKKGTFRRPIYVECREDGVYIQPEGIRFDERDFLLSRYPGNPFDSALRATSQHFLSVAGGKTDSGETIEPYPLIIVRPSGAEYFYAAIDALASWGELYGYEFVDEDQEIEYPASDPTLRTALAQQTEIARMRLSAQLAEALSARRAIVAQYYESGGAPRSYGGSGGGDAGPQTELTSRFGSNVRLGAAKVAASENAQEGASGGNGASNLATGTTGAAAPTGSALASGSGVPNRSNGAFSQAIASTPQYNGAFAQYIANAPSNVANSNANDSSNGGAVGSNAANGSAAYDSSNGVNSGAATGEYASNVGANAASNTGAANNVAQNIAQGETRYASNAAATEMATTATGTPEYLARIQGRDQSASESNDASQSVDPTHTLGNTTYARGAKGDSSSGELASNTTYIKPNEKQKPQESTMPKEAFSLSKERPSETGNERGISMRCSANEYVFPKQPGARSAMSVSCSGRSKEEIEKELLDSIAYYIKSWGVAGRNAYWAPFLKVEVEPGGEERFNELSDFCKRQGLSIITVKTTKQIKR